MLPPSGTVHPRVCGELARHGGLRQTTGRFIPACAGNSPPAVAASGVRDGSSPRVRGTPYGATSSMASCRFIPACAGNSPRAGTATRRSTVHPRVCGELATARGISPRAAGSSPRVRGTPGWRSSPPARARFIPACAGNSCARTTRRCGSSVHPRVCGELGGRHGHRRVPVRFIPACAGNSPIVSLHADEARGSSPRVRGTPHRRHQRALALPVHPRVCGELAAPFARRTVVCGSSPRVRGTRRRTPSNRVDRTVHPRVCGELPVRHSTGDGMAGSSPRVRGTPWTTANQCANWSVHPRVCGELHWRNAAQAEPAGSSPRVRGTPRPHWQVVGRARFIPACAGNSPRRRHEPA